MITLDTLRKDFISFYNNQINKTIEIDNFAREAISFENAVTTVPLTVPAHFFIFTGMYPYNHNVRDNGETYKESYLLIAELLKNNGYETHAFISSNIFNPNIGIFKGFKEIHSNLNSVTGEANCFETLKLVENFFLRYNKTKPLFLWIHFYDPHFPYMPLNFNEINTKNAYKEEVKNLDSAFGKLIGMIKSYLGEKTLIAVLSDHGEALGEYGEETHGYFIFENTIQVIFLLKIPGFKGKRVDGLVSIIDLCPTILSYLNVKYDEMDGINLLDAFKKDKKIPKREIYIESLHLQRTFKLIPIVGIREEKEKLIWDTDIHKYIIKNGKEEEIFLDNKMRNVYLRKFLKIINKEESENYKSLKSLGYINPLNNKKLNIKDKKELLEIIKISENIICNAMTGKEYLSRGSLDLSIEYFDKCLKLQPFFEEAIVFKSLALLLKKIPLAALECLKKLKKENDFSNYLKGWAYLQMVEGVKAENYFRKSLAIKPEFIDYKIGLAKSLLIQGRYDEGEKILIEILNKDRENVEAKAALKELYEKKKGK